jgi:hypothetical protein
MEDTIAAWLHQDDEQALEQVESPTVGHRPPSAEAAGRERAPAAGAAQARARKPIRLVSIERRGALFEFPADRLRSDEFRCAVPRVCVHCLAPAHLTAHVIVFSPQLRDSISLEGEHPAGRLSIPQDKLAEAEGPALLNLLPEVPDVPPPGNLPMPYWVCELCRGRGWIAAQIKVNPKTGKGVCRLLLRNLKLALAFLGKAGGKATREYRKLEDFVARIEQDPWDALPSVVRHRVEQWFRPRIGERFLAYVPDRSFARTEDGMNGLVVSSHRLVYHHPPLHQESPRQNELSIQVRLAKDKEVATIEAARFKGRPIALDRGGMMLLRQALSHGDFKAQWR